MSVPRRRSLAAGARRGAGRSGPPPRRSGQEVGQPIDVTIEQIGNRGDGVADSPMGRLYVPLTVPGDRVRVRPMARRGDGRAADLVAVLEPGRDRRPPPCRHFGVCGGCALQHLSDSGYIGWKLERLAGALRHSGVMAEHVDSPVQTPPGGRRRAVLAAVRGAADRTLDLGFRMRRGHAVVDLAVCPVLAPAIVALLPAVRDLLSELLPPCRMVQVAVALTESGLDVVFAGLDPPDLQARERLAAFAEAADLARLSWRSADIMPPEPVVERRPPTVTFGGVPVRPPPGAFLQASAAGEAALIAAVADAVDGLSPVADLFAGVGTFALPMARAGVRVHAVDSDAAGLRALAAAAAQAGLNATCEARDLMTRPLRLNDLRSYAAVVVDPPRAGARAQAEALAASAVPVVVAISCNPETFARDARVLVDGGFRLSRLKPVDQFLWSPHLELAAVFQR